MAVERSKCVVSRVPKEGVEEAREVVGCKPKNIGLAAVVLSDDEIDFAQGPYELQGWAEAAVGSECKSV